MLFLNQPYLSGPTDQSLTKHVTARMRAQVAPVCIVTPDWLGVTDPILTQNFGLIEQKVL